MNDTNKKHVSKIEKPSEAVEALRKRETAKSCKIQVPAVPPQMSEEKRKALEAALVEQFKDGEDMEDDEDDDMALYRPR